MPEKRVLLCVHSEVSEGEFQVAVQSPWPGMKNEKKRKFDLFLFWLDIGTYPELCISEQN